LKNQTKKVELVTKHPVRFTKIFLTNSVDGLIFRICVLHKHETKHTTRAKLPKKQQIVTEFLRTIKHPKNYYRFPQAFLP